MRIYQGGIRAPGCIGGLRWAVSRAAAGLVRIKSRISFIPCYIAGSDLVVDGGMTA
jgi:hypothetical protein